MEKQRNKINEIRRKKRYSEDRGNPISIRANNMIKKRSCLMCGKMFTSKGPYNRRCAKCARLIDVRNKDSFYTCSEYKTQLSSSDISGLDSIDL